MIVTSRLMEVIPKNNLVKDELSWKTLYIFYTDSLQYAIDILKKVRLTVIIKGFMK